MPKAERSIFKAPQQPTGRAYIAALTFPFRDCSFVVKVQCLEIGVTGMRDATIMAMLTAKGALSADPEHFSDWLSDPYDTAEKGPLTRNLSEDRKYDEMFPDHPLSRARRTLAELEATVQLSPALQAAPPFRYPAA
ncbi:hypothetical protein [Caulobacter sp. 17J65-9]|uniref:hypothetical protein n=1 Tax=Caulobacter sp. 17J65-9 TaxID=2709382 RepID=UPI0013C8AD70|nr:hypothetical protein [Caulobacter sp. 17J65-9]NEX93459.1 hypothetical protein [Caulobacter sp. 17J65-9]